MFGPSKTMFTRLHASLAIKVVTSQPLLTRDRERDGDGRTCGHWDKEF